VRHPVALTATLSSIVLACCVCVGALDPSRDISQYAHTSWKIRDGFVKGTIHSISQTPDGYLWLGTDSGLFRFDGIRVVPWQPPAGAKLPANYISQLLVAHDGTLWIGTLRGLASWKDGSLTQYPETAGAYVSSLLEDREQTLWFGVTEASKGRFCSIRAGKIECHGAGSFGLGVFALYQDHKGNLWAGGEKELWRWAPGSPERYALPRGVSQIRGLAEDDSGMLLLSTDVGLKQLVAGKVENYSLPGITGHFSPSKFLRSSDGSLWISSHEGLLRLHHGRVDRFGAADGLSGDSADRIFEDREENIWVTTPEGLGRFREYAIPTISQSQGLSSLDVYTIQAIRDGSIWTTTADGLNRWANGGMTVYRGRNAPRGGKQGGGETGPRFGYSAHEIANNGLVGNPHSLGLDERVDCGLRLPTECSISRAADLSMPRVSRADT